MNTGDYFKLAFDQEKYDAIRGGLIEMAYSLPHREACMGMISQLIGIAEEAKLKSIVFGHEQMSSYQWVKEWQALIILDMLEGGDDAHQQ